MPARKYCIKKSAASELLIKNATLITFDDGHPFFQPGNILVRDGIIQKVSEEEIPISNAIPILNLNRDYVVFPGFINAHNHIYSALARGVPLEKPPTDFSGVLENLWWRLDKALDEESVYYSACAAMMDALSGGTTSMIDHHSSPSFISGSLEILRQVADDFGVGINLCYEISDRDGKDKRDEALRENERMLEKNTDGAVSALVGLHASFTVSDETLKKAAELVQKYDTGIHIHLCEDRIDMQHSLKNYGMSPLQRLEKFGLLNEKSVLVHGVHLIEEDYALLKKYNPTLIHNPRSNMNNAVGTCDVQRLFAEEVRVGLGTDGMTSSLLPDISTAVWLLKHQTSDPASGFNETLQMLTQNNPGVYQRVTRKKAGRIAPGYSADFAIFHYPSPTPFSPETWLGHLFFAISGQNPVYTITNGQIRYDHGCFPGIDLAQFSENSRKVSRKLWSRM